MKKFLVFCVLTLGVGVLGESGPKVVDKVRIYIMSRVDS